MEYRIMKITSITASIIIVPIEHMSYLLSLIMEENTISLGCNLLSLRLGNLASLLCWLEVSIIYFDFPE
jgi:hypothetical protein